MNEKELRNLDERVALMAFGLPGDPRPAASMSEDIRAAWDVVERMQAVHGFGLTLRLFDNGDWDGTPPAEPYWQASFTPINILTGDNDFIVWGRTAPEAICKAAVKALGKRARGGRSGLVR